MGPELSRVSLARVSLARRLQFLLSFALTSFLGSAAASQSEFVNFESSLVKPIAISGDRLLVLHGPENRLAVYDLSEDHRLVDEIPVGLEPVSVRIRPGAPNEAWVVNSLSDDVTIVDLDAGKTVARIRVGDEPADVGFSHDGGKAYVTIGGRDRLAVIDARQRVLLRRIALPGASPRTVTASRNGQFVIVSFLHSGNGSTILSHEHPQVPRTDPQIGVIVPSTDPRSPVFVEDIDVVGVDTRTDEIDSRMIRGVGTTLFGHAVHPKTGKIYVTNTEARNTIARVDRLRGRFVRNRVSIVTPLGSIFRVESIDLNPHLGEAQTVPAAERGLSLAQPTDLEFDVRTGNIFVAAYGSGWVAVLDPAGHVMHRIRVGHGPRGLAVRPETNRLYCFNRLDHTVSEIDITSNQVVATFPVGSYDPTPESVRRGRRYLYDAGLSGTGAVSCASCHIDADRDSIAWDLGDPNGVTIPGPEPGFEYSPLKGPMTTLPLKGLQGTGALHWRGDREALIDFSAAFVSLLGRQRELPAPHMEAFSEFVETLRLMPNPNLAFDRTLSETAERGLGVYIVGDSYNQCLRCHRMPAGTNLDRSLSRAIVNLSQNFKPPKLTTAYRKVGRFEKTGFGFGFEGAFPTVVEFLTRPRSVGAPETPFWWRHDLSVLVSEFDTGTAPVVGREILLDRKSESNGSASPFLLSLMDEARLGHCDLILHAHSKIGRRELLFDPEFGSFRGEDSSLGLFSLARILRLGRQGAATFLVQAVPAGSGPRLSIDRDSDELPNEDERRLGLSPTNPDRDGDGWKDGWEVALGSDPSRAESMPAAQTVPVIHGVRIVESKPFGVLWKRFVLVASGVVRGAHLLATDSDGGTTSHSVFPTGSDEWTTFDGVHAERVGERAAGFQFVLTNPPGAVSAPFRVE